MSSYDHEADRRKDDHHEADRRKDDRRKAASADEPPELALYINGRQVASAFSADDVMSRTKGLLGQTAMPPEYEVLALERASWIHTFGMQFALDVAYVDRSDQVIALVSMKPWRVGRPRLKSKRVLETAQGNFAKWGVKVGDVAQLKGISGEG